MDRPEIDLQSIYKYIISSRRLRSLLTTRNCRLNENDRLVLKCFIIMPFSVRTYTRVIFKKSYFIYEWQNIGFDGIYIYIRRIYSDPTYR